MKILFVAEERNRVWPIEGSLPLGLDVKRSSKRGMVAYDYPSDPVLGA